MKEEISKTTDSSSTMNDQKGPKKAGGALDRKNYLTVLSECDW